MTNEVFNLFMAAFYIAVIAGAIVFVFWMTIQKRKNMERMKGNIKHKLSSSVSLSAKDITLIGRGFDLSPKSSRDVIYRLYAEVNEPKAFSELQNLVVEIEKEEPFDELPDEVKPSLSRLLKIIESSKDESDKHVLLPITSTLNKYTELKLEQEKTKKQTSRAYIITIISFVVGAISFYFTLKSPSDVDIKRAMEQVLIERSATNTNEP
ncbi:hypothetical protein [Stutzerimonas balearica]|uniref:Uncharacterized protein n=1 Tax=Stutzerimonas balearica DSM 6083 TaxID=1123016 RepID=A0ABY0QVF5_9GAMM|nr:hypothetical protein [Stutzerimonas balearica]SDL97124.1 hypothetical protein SAMN05660875_101347 [Stutzerimonas balearica DSM 6083]